VLASIIVLHVAAADVAAAATTAIARAVDQAMNAGGRVTVRGGGAGPDLAATCAETGVAGAAVVAWTSAEREAAVRVRHCASGDESRFQLAFAAGDPTAERARSVGFVIASALHASTATEAGPATATKAAETSDRAAEAPSPVADAPASAAASVAMTGLDPVRPAAKTGRALDAFFLAGVPLGGAGGGIGGGVAGRFAAGARWGVRLGLQARSGQIDAAQSSLFEAGVTAGVTTRVRSAGPGGWPGIGLRLDVSGRYEAVTHFSSDDPDPVRRHRFFPAVSALGELTWPFGPLDLQLGAGVEAALAVADVVVRGSKVAEIPAWRATLEAGFRVGF
jgi:hypothetical protein